MAPFAAIGSGGFAIVGASGAVASWDAQAASPTILHSLTLTDTSGAGSTGFFRVGLAFESGDVPAGQILSATADSATIPLAMMETNTWSDGSLRKATVVGEAGTFTASQAKTIEVSAVAGLQSVSGEDAFALIAALTEDRTVEIRSHTGSENDTNIGNLDFSMKAAFAAGNSVRREVQDDNSIVIRAYAWQQVGTDQHLICRHYVNLWLDNIGNVDAVEWTPVLCQPWLVEDPFGIAQTKQARSYTATVKKGGATLESHTITDHAYYCQWAALRTDDDEQHARPLWGDEGVAMPTLNVAYSTASRQKMMRAGYLPPLALAETYSATDLQNLPGIIQNDYTPLGEPHVSNYSLSNRANNVNSGGGYQARGIIGHLDGAHVCEQTTARARQARVAAQTGLAINFCILDHRTGAGQGKKIPHKFNQLGAQTYTGLNAEANYTIGNGAVDITDDAPVGGTGTYEVWDDAHHHAYSYYMAFIEGERYLMDPVIDAAFQPPARNGFDGFTSNPKQLWFNEGRTLPSTTYGTSYIAHLQERAPGWCILAMDHAYALVPDADPHKALITNAIDQGDTWLDVSLTGLPSDQDTVGVFFSRNEANTVKSFMHNLTGMCALRSKLLHEGSNPGVEKLAVLTARRMARQAAYSPYAAHTDNQTLIVPGETAPFDSWLTGTDDVAWVAHKYNTSGSLLTTSTSVKKGMHPSDGDRVLIHNTVGDSLGGPVPPAELVQGTIYFVRDLTVISDFSHSFRLAATPGGAALTISDVSGFAISRDLTVSRTATVPASSSGTTLFPPDDDFLTIADAMMHMMWFAESPELSASAMQSWLTFFSSRKTAGYDVNSTWALDATQLRVVP